MTDLKKIVILKLNILKVGTSKDTNKTPPFRLLFTLTHTSKNNRMLQVSGNNDVHFGK